MGMNVRDRLLIFTDLGDLKCVILLPCCYQLEQGKGFTVMTFAVWLGSVFTGDCV